MSLFAREALLKRFSDPACDDSPPYDLMVVGGGINGTAIARDAALRGLRVLLLEKDDFGAGTSALSSRLIHGGLRYLQNLEWGLVRESLQERERLLKNAPHLVRPLPLAIPVYRSSRHPAWLIRLGLLLYDGLFRSQILPPHRFYSWEGFLRQCPVVQAEGLTGGAIYYDAQVAMPERLCLEFALSARETGNADLLSHVQVIGARGIGPDRLPGGLNRLYFLDRLQRHAPENDASEVHFASGRVIINAAGPWVDQVLRLSGKPMMPRIGGTRGSHIIVDRFPGGPETALYTEADDGRPFFIIPWRERYYLIGTTDLPCGKDPDTVAADQDEADYLLHSTNRVLPQAELTPADIRYSYCGVRPLPATTERNAGRITRRHWVENHHRASDGALPGWMSVIGGKLTTARNLAEEVVDAAVSAYSLRLPDGGWVPPSPTANSPLPGAAFIGNLGQYRQAQAEAALARYGVSPELTHHLIDLYGDRYGRVLDCAVENQEWLQPLRVGYPDIGAQVIYAVRAEMAYTLADVMLRRVGCGLEGDMGFGALGATARLMAEASGWSAERTESEMNNYQDAMRRLRQSHRGGGADAIS